MTIFDTIKYPLGAVPTYEQVMDLPEAIFEHWYTAYYTRPNRKRSWDVSTQQLHRLLLEYNTQDCEITNKKYNDNP